MKKILAVVLIMTLLLPAFAWAEESTEAAPTAVETSAITIFGYVIVIVPPTEESGATIGIFAAGENGEATGDPISSFTVGGILGKVVSSVARTIAPGPGHGKAVSAFVKACNEERKVAKDAVREEKREQKELKKQERLDEKEEHKLEKQERIETRNESKDKNIRVKLGDDEEDEAEELTVTP